MIEASDRRRRESIAEEAFQEFNERGKIVYHDPRSNLTVRTGHLFEAQTVKGHKNLIVVAAARTASGGKPFTDGRMYADWIFYGHGSHVRRVPLEIFIRAVECGELQPTDPKRIDTERLDMALIMLDGMINSRTPEQTLNLYEDEATDFLMKGQFNADPFQGVDE